MLFIFNKEEEEEGEEDEEDVEDDIFYCRKKK